MRLDQRPWLFALSKLSSNSTKIIIFIFVHVDNVINVCIKEIKKQRQVDISWRFGERLTYRRLNFPLTYWWFCAWYFGSLTNLRPRSILPLWRIMMYIILLSLYPLLGSLFCLYFTNGGHMEVVDGCYGSKTLFFNTLWPTISKVLIYFFNTSHFTQ